MKRWGVIVVLAAGQFIMVLDTTVMNVSISQVVDDLDTSVTQVQLAITAYTLVMASFMLIGGKLGDIWGRRRTFTIGLIIYGCGSLTTALSPNVGVLLIGWSLVEGLGAALVVPAIASLAAENYKGRERAVAYSLLGAVAGAGAALGPLIGGWFTTELSWRVVFAGETAVVLAMLPAIRIIKEGEQAAKPRLDVVGGALSVVGLSLFVLAILKSSTWGLLTPKGALEINGTEITPFGLSVVPFMMIAGGLVLWAFFNRERKLEAEGGTPLLRPSLFRIDQLRAGLSTLGAQYLLLAGTFFIIPLYLQVVLGKDALETGIQILPMSLAMVAAAMVGPKLAERSSPRRVVQAGLFLVLAGATILMATVGPELKAGGFTVGITLFGAGIGFSVSQLGNVVMSSVGDEARSEAGGLQGTAQNLGSSLGTALIGAVMLTSLTAGFQEGIADNPAIPENVRQELVANTEDGIEIIPADDAREIVEQAGLPPDQVDAIVGEYSEAQIEALKKSFFLAALLVFVGLAFSRRLPAEPLGSEPSPA